MSTMRSCLTVFTTVVLDDLGLECLGELHRVIFQRQVAEHGDSSTDRNELAAHRVGDDGAVGAHRRARSSTRDGSESDEGDDRPELERHL